MKGLPQATFFTGRSWDCEECAFVEVYLEVYVFEGFCICIGLPGLFQCWQGVIKNRNRPPVVISVVFTKSKNQF
jgi:hypothetical protein